MSKVKIRPFIGAPLDSIQKQQQHHALDHLRRHRFIAPLAVSVGYCLADKAQVQHPVDSS
jgi:hypothetical protein